MLKLHIVDTAMMYATFCLSNKALALLSAAGTSRGADVSVAPIDESEAGPVIPESSSGRLELAMGPRSTCLDIEFAKYLGGKQSHRLNEAKKILRGTELVVIAAIAQWRKEHSFVYANAFHQSWLLTPEWAALKCLQVPDVGTGAVLSTWQNRTVSSRTF